MNWLLVIVGGAVGAPLRFLTDRAVQKRHDTLLPPGTFTAHVAGFLAPAPPTRAVSAVPA
ncbi:fluoride efflux transporter CrcB, partial [Streptomyces sp. PSKA30]|nr:fluoride efflux transporter CrcB [Streptomyces sp. PSKA30]